jgi:hypothetical protein
VEHGAQLSASGRRGQIPKAFGPSNHWLFRDCH